MEETKTKRKVKVLVGKNSKPQEIEYLIHEAEKQNVDLEIVKSENEDDFLVLDDSHKPPGGELVLPYMLSSSMGGYLYDDSYFDNKGHGPAPRKIRGYHAEVRNSSKDPKIGRNSPCPCDSGKKYKHCCIPVFNHS